MRLFAEAAVDHVILYGESVQPLNEALGRLGFHSPDGKFYMFSRDYLECLTPGAGVMAKLGRSCDFVPGPSGLHSVIFWSDDADASYRALTEAGYRMAVPVLETTRAVDAGGRKGTAVFRASIFDEPLFPLGESMFVQHTTPELVYIPGEDLHPNGVDAIEELYLCIPDAAKAEETRALLQRTADLIRGDHPQHHCINRLSISDDWKPEFGVSADPARSCVCGIRFSCRDFEKTRAALAGCGYPVWEKDGGLVADLSQELNLFFYFHP